MLVWGWMLPHGRMCQVVYRKSMAVHGSSKGEIPRPYHG
jgi:hypothetical protein